MCAIMMIHLYAVNFYWSEPYNVACCCLYSSEKQEQSQGKGNAEVEVDKVVELRYQLFSAHWMSSYTSTLDWHLSIVEHAFMIRTWLTAAKWRRQCKRANKGKKCCNQCMWCSPVDQQAAGKERILNFMDNIIQYVGLISHLWTLNVCFKHTNAL